VHWFICIFFYWFIISFLSLPTRFLYTGQITLVNKFPETNPAYAEFAQVTVRSSATRTNVAFLNLKFKFFLNYVTCFSHKFDILTFLCCFRKGHAQKLEQFLSFLLVTGRRIYSDLQSAQPVYGLVINLGKKNLLS
jgi:hypothetical protein